MAGFTDLPDVKWLGKHFQSLIETRREELTKRVRGDPKTTRHGMEYFTEDERRLLHIEKEKLSWAGGAYSQT